MSRGARPDALWRGLACRETHRWSRDGDARGGEPLGGVVGHHEERVEANGGEEERHCYEEVLPACQVERLREKTARQ